MIEYGVLITLGFVFIGAKTPKYIWLRLLAYSLWLDIIITIIAYCLHWGTFSGVMSAAIAGMLTSLFTSAALRTFGCIKNGEYHPGFFNLKKEGMKLKEQKNKNKDLYAKLAAMQANS